MQEVLIYTDGACSGNPGPGGWAWVRLEGESQQEASGAAASTTNQRMELEAAAEGLESLTEPANVRLISDSKYVVQGLNEWMDGWIRNGWRNASRKPVANQDLWQRLQTQRERHQLIAEWTRGHAGNTHNERCDQLAVEAIEQLRTRGGTR
jgi:ribonuclease HI